MRSEEEGEEEEEEEEEMVEREDEAAEEEQGEEEDKETVESEAEVNREEEDGLGDTPKEETEEVKEEEVDVMEVEKEEDACQFGDPESGSLSPKKEEVQMKVQTKAARKAQSQWKPREAKDRTRTRKCATKSSTNSKQSPRRTPKQSPSRTPKQSPVQTPKQSPQRTGKQSPEVCTVVKGRPRIFSACRAKSRVQESKVKTGCDIVKHTLGKGRLKTKLPDKKSKPKEVAKTEWDSELTQEEEDELIRQGQDFKSQGLHLAMDILLDFAQNILNENPYRMRSFVDNRPTKEWYQNFVRRHPILNAPVLTVRKTARQISQEEERKRKAAEPVKSPTTSKKKTKKKPAKGSRKRKDSQAESSYSEVDDSGNAGTTTEEEIDTNICSMCQDEYNDQPDEWIGCSSCERWFHKFCIHIDVTGYSDKEIEELDFICEFCGCGGVTWTSWSHYILAGISTAQSDQCFLKPTVVMCECKLWLVAFKPLWCCELEQYNHPASKAGLVVSQLYNSTSSWSPNTQGFWFLRMSVLCFVFLTAFDTANNFVPPFVVLYLNSKLLHLASCGSEKNGTVE